MVLAAGTRGASSPGTVHVTGLREPPNGMSLASARNATMLIVGSVREDTLGMGNAPQETIWDMDDHTPAKHALLRAYLIRWMSIIRNTQLPAVYVDAFAGPGRYRGGEEGSPVLVLNLLSGGRGMSNDVSFVFLETREDRFLHLRTEVSRLTLPQNFRVEIENKDCVSYLRQRAAEWRTMGRRLGVLFAFIDPFGLDLPFDVVAGLLARPSSEVLITFMTDYVKRFATEHIDRIDDLLGEPGASLSIGSLPPEKRPEEIRRRYRERLGKDVPFVRWFSVRRRSGLPIYDLFFAGRDPTGHYVFKEAMWKLDESGEFSFDPSCDPNQGTLFGGGHPEALADDLIRRFRGASVGTTALFEYVRDHTIYLERHGNAALKLLEDGERPQGRIRVSPKKEDGSSRRGQTYPEGLVVAFPGYIGRLPGETGDGR